MASSEEAPQEKKVRSRSPSYPSDGLETCFKWTKKVYEAEKRSSVPILVAVKHMGYTSLSGASRTGLAAMKKFGLVLEEVGEKVRVSDEAVRLILAPEESERFAILRAMAKKPDIIKEILAEHPDGLPSDDTLKYKLVMDRGFGDDAANTFLKALHETLRFAKLDPKEYAATRESEAVQQEPERAAPPQAPTPSTNGVPTQKPLETPDVGPLLHVWSLGGGVTVQLRSSAPLSPKHFKRLAKYVELAAEAEEDDDDVEPEAQPSVS